MLRSCRTPSAPRKRSSRPYGAVGLVLLALVANAIPAAAASIRADGLLEVDGRPMFPIGLVELGTYMYPDWNQRIQDAGANLVWDIEIAYADTMPSCAQVLTAAEEGGYYLMLGSGDTWNWDDPNTPQLEVDQMMYEIGETNTLMSCVAAHPDRVIAFANRDEPVWTTSRNMIGDIDEAHIHNTFSQIHGLKPDALVAMNFAPTTLSQDLATWKAGIRSYASATDVMMFACYPYPAGPGTCGPYNVLGYPDCKMDRLAIGADTFLGELNEPGQPLWMIIQAYKSIPLKEARWEAATSIVHGATGILWAGWTWWHDLGDGNVNWPVTRQVMSEFSSLQPWLTGADMPGATSDNPDVELRALEANSSIVVLAISRNGFTGPATLHLPISNNKRIKVLHEGRTLTASGGSVTDTFDGYEAHVYRYSVLEGVAIGHGATDAPVVEATPHDFTMQTYPSPSTGRTTVRFTLPHSGTALFTVYDAAGRRVAVVGRGNYAAGVATVDWDGRDLSGQAVGPGVYFIRGRTSNGDAATARVLIRR
jgi:FlgD Ig-like domain